MAFLLTSLRVPLSWPALVRRTLYEAFWKDNCLGMAAQLAYYFFFALFPALLLLLGVASYFQVSQLIDEIVASLRGVVPPEALGLITDQIRKISLDQQGGLITVGMLTALWSSSAAVVAIIDTLNTAYDIEEGRPWWKVRLLAIGLTIGLAAFILVSFALVLAGPSAAEWLADRFALGAAFEWSWKILQWPLVFALVSAGVAIVYYFAPDAEQDWIWLTPGSVFATTLWLGASIAFKYYIVSIGSYTESYGIIGGVMVLMLWFYLSGLVLLVGAELNAEIEHASELGKDEGEKVPGERRRLGTARVRAWAEARRRRGEPPPTAEEIRDRVGPTPELDAPAARELRRRA